MDNPLELLENKIIDFESKNLKAQVEAGKIPLKEKSKEFLLAFLAFINLNQHNPKSNYWKKQEELLANFFHEDMWNKENGYYDILTQFLDEEKISYFLYAWKNLKNQPYQSGYYRRSFRAPNHEQFTKIKQLNFLQRILIPLSVYNYNTGKTAYYQLSLEEEIRFSNNFYIGERNLLWSAAIDLGDKEVSQLLEDIIFNKDETGKISRDIIKSLLNSSKKEAWELVGKLLLAAQRQEGLRQTVLESLDETSIGALKYILNIIIENKLTRFSSVVRAIDTWAGLGWEAEKETTVRKVAQEAYDYLTHPETIEKTIKGSNNQSIYMALWAQGVIDIEQTQPLLQYLLEKGNTEKKCLALKFISETQYPELELPFYYQALKLPENLQILAFTLPRLTLITNYNKKLFDSPEYKDTFNILYNLSQTITEKEKIFEGKVFSWLRAKFDKHNIYYCLIRLAKNEEELNAILANFEELDIQTREDLSRQILGNFYCYSFSYIKKDKEPKTVTEKQRNFSLQAISDRSEAIIASAINTLSHVSLNEKEINSIVNLYKRKGANLRKQLTELITSQPISIIIPLVEKLLIGDIEQRTGALDIMLQLKQNKELSKKIQQWVAEYKKRGKISKKEDALLEQVDSANNPDVLSEENGFKLYNPKNITPFNLPKIDPKSNYSQSIKNNSYGFSKPWEKIEKDLDKLANLFMENKDFEYEVTNYDNSIIKVLLINTFRNS